MSPDDVKHRVETARAILRYAVEEPGRITPLQAIGQALHELDGIRLGPKRPGGYRAVKNEILSPRETDVLALLVEGLTVKEIGERHKVTYNTAKTQVRAIYFGLGVDNRAQAVVTALREGLVEPV